MLKPIHYRPVSEWSEQDMADYLKACPRQSHWLNVLALVPQEYIDRIVQMLEKQA